MSSLGVTFQNYSSKMLCKKRKSLEDSEDIRIPKFLNDYHEEKHFENNSRKETKYAEILDIAIQRIYNNISTKSYDSNYYIEEENYKIKKSSPFDKLNNYFDIQNPVLDESLEEPFFTLESDDE